MTIHSSQSKIQAQALDRLPVHRIRAARRTWMDSACLRRAPI